MTQPRNGPALRTIGGYEIEGTGTVDLALELDAPDGFANASGSARLTGRSLVVSGLGSLGDLLSGFDILPVAIDELDLRIEITEGKARVVRGVKGVVIGQLLVSIIGYGELFELYSRNFLMEEFWALTILLFAFAMIVSELVAYLEKRIEFYAGFR